MTNLMWNHGLYIGGKWDKTGTLREVKSPVTGQPIGGAAYGTTTHLAWAADAAKAALSGPWAKWTGEKRAELLQTLATLHHQNRQRFADIILAEVGSPRWFCDGPQVDHPARILSYYAGLADKPRTFTQSRHNGGKDQPGTLVRKVPVGAVGVITPWNMPQKTIMMKVAPALAAGCTVVIKPAPETPFDALLFAELCEEAGVPPGVVNVVPATRDVSGYLPRSPYLDKIAFTGSTQVGKHIAQVCGQDIRRYSLELGGKSATVLFDDADLDAWQDSVLTASLLNNGQICSNQTRIVVDHSILGEVVERLRDLLDQIKVGDPSHPDTDIGPLITPVQLGKYMTAVSEVTDRGGHVYTAPAPHLDPALLGGNWARPAIVTDVTPDDPIAQDEVFGPVLTVLPFTSEEEAIGIANNSRYGLHAGVWTASPRRGRRVAEQIRAGQIQINHAEMPLHTPLGGFKESGWGRELGPEGIEHYQETQAIAQVWK